MVNKEPTIYESWNMMPISIPDRSRLYQLEPIGLGTSSVESLISYISRLAEAYCVPTGLLVTSEIAPLMKAEYVFSSKEGGLDKIFANQTRALNGRGAWAKSLIQALESLTLRVDLSCLTMLPWEAIIPQKELLKPIRAWCPNCYGNWQIAGQPFYEPLLWSLACIDVCVYHRQPLHTTCSNCQKVNRPLAWLSRPGYCSKCKEWLGSYEVMESARNQEIVGWDWHIWAYQNVGDLIADSPRKSLNLSKETCPLILSYYTHTKFEGNVSAFARWLGLERVQLDRWLKGKSTPTLKTLLKICFRLRIPLLEFLAQESTVIVYPNRNKSLSRNQKAKKLPFNAPDLEKNSEQIRQMKAALAEDPPPSLSLVAERLGYQYTTTLYYYASDLCHAISAKYVNYQKAVKHENMQSALEAVIASDVYPPLSLQKAARAIGTNVHTIKKHFPQLCSSISNRYAKYLSEGREKRVQALQEEICQVAVRLNNQGIEPTASRISPYLKKPRSILQKEAKVALKQVRYELGWQ